MFDEEDTLLLLRSRVSKTKIGNKLKLMRQKAPANTMGSDVDRDRFAEELTPLPLLLPNNGRRGILKNYLGPL
jgi:hypothetical protein